MDVSLFAALVPASRNEYQTIKQQLEAEKIPALKPGDPPRSFHSLMLSEQAQLEKKRLAGKFFIKFKLSVVFYSYIHLLC